MHLWIQVDIKWFREEWNDMFWGEFLIEYGQVQKSIYKHCKCFLSCFDVR
jgi:hypothetical protein